MFDKEDIKHKIFQFEQSINNKNELMDKQKLIHTTFAKKELGRNSYNHRNRVYRSVPPTKPFY